MAAVANVAINVDSRGAVGKLREVANSSKELEKAAQGASTAVTKTGRELKTAANGMQYFIDATGRARKANGQFVTTAEAAAAGLEKQGRSAQRAAGNFNGLIGTVGKLAAAYLTLNAAQSAVSAGIQRIESERRIQFLAKQYGEVDQLARAAANASDRFGQSQTTANKAVADIYARLRPVGVSLENIVSVYNGFNTAARISGSTAVEAENAFRQLSQALGSGALRGDEFNSIAEQVPGILTAISQETGVAQGKLREYAADGKITADVVIAALQRIEKDGADQLKEALGGPEQAIRDFQNATEDVQVALTTAIVPEMARAFRDLAAIIVGLEPAIRFIGGLIADALGGFRALVDSIRGGPVVERLRQGGQLGFNVGQEKEQLRSFFGKERFAQLERQARESAKAQAIPFVDALGERLRVAIKVQDRAKQIQARPKPPELPTRPFRIGDTVGGGGGGGGGGGRSAESVAKEQQRAAEAAAKEAERVAEIIRSRTAEGQIIRINSELQDKITAAEMAGDKMLVIRLQGQQKEIDLQYKYAQELAKETDLNAQKAIIFEGQNALVANQIDTQRELTSLQAKADQDRLDALQKHIERQYELNTAAQNQIKLADGIANAMGQGIGSAFDALIRGSNDLRASFQQIASGVLIDIANQLLRIFVIEQAINAIRGILTPFNPATPLGAGVNGRVGRFGTLGPNYGIPQYANGGSIKANQLSIVGERGPELFVPNRSGTIVPNSSLGGANIVVNVDASGTNVQGDAPSANQLGRAIGAAVQAELIKQKRPGGLLAS